MKIRFANNDEVLNWNHLILTNPDGGNLFQAKQFADLKVANNWQTKFLVVDDLYSLVLERQIPLLGKFWYMPKGPGITNVSSIQKFVTAIKKFARQNSVFLVRIEPEILANDENIKALAKLDLPTFRGIQAANTVVVDISGTLDEIVAKFTSKTRGNIRAAQKAGVTTEVVPVDEKNCATFYNMMTKTINGRSHVRPYEYFKQYWQSYAQTGNGIFMFAYDESGQVQSVDYINILGTKATRKDAGSVRDHSVRGASALLELEAIKYLKEQGITTYDLYGAPPSDRLKDPSHPFYGFGTFKAGFNREQVTDYIGCRDIVTKPLAYRIWATIGERVAHRLFRYQNHDLYY